MIEVNVHGTPFEISRTKDSWIVNGQATHIDIQKVPGSDNRHFHIIKDGKSFAAELIHWVPSEKKMKVKIRSTVYELSIQDETDRLLKQLGFSTTTEKKLNEMKAPMPGLVLKVLVNEGDTIQKGDPIIVLESMKMENILKASGGGTVSKIVVSPGMTVEKGDPMVKF
jgi:biotin carboxyl carrier protein